MKKVIILIFILTLLFTGCQMGADKIYYPTSNSSSSQSSTGSETEGATTQTTSKIKVQVASNFDENAVPSAFVSSNTAATSSAPAYNRDEVLQFDDPVLEKIIRENMLFPKLSGDITVGEWAENKFDSISLEFDLKNDSPTIYLILGYSYINKTETKRVKYGLINSYAVLSKLYGLKKVEISLLANEAKTFPAINLNHFIGNKSLEILKIYGTNSVRILLTGDNKLSSYSKLKELKLMYCKTNNLPDLSKLKNLYNTNVILTNS